jgi:hypothetical protein
VHQARDLRFVQRAEDVPELVEKDSLGAMPPARPNQLLALVVAELHEGAVDHVVLPEAARGPDDQALAEHLGVAGEVQIVRRSRQRPDEPHDDVDVLPRVVVHEDRERRLELVVGVHRPRLDLVDLQV